MPVFEWSLRVRRRARQGADSETIAMRLFVMSLQRETEGRLARARADATRPNHYRIIGGHMSRHNCVLLFLLCLTTLARAQTSRAASVASYLERGNSWFAKGQWDRVIADYDLAIAFDGRVAVPYYNRGLARHRKGDLSGALSDYNRAVELNTRFADTYLNRGAIQVAQGQYDTAIGDFSKAIEINPRDTRAFLNVEIL